MSTQQVDTTGVKVGDPDPWPDDDYDCCPAVDEGWGCTAPVGHTGPHVAAGPRAVLAIWGQS
jgi:hypothetical protein